MICKNNKNITWDGLCRRCLFRQARVWQYTHASDETAKISKVLRASSQDLFLPLCLPCIPISSSETTLLRLVWSPKALDYLIPRQELLYWLQYNSVSTNSISLCSRQDCFSCEWGKVTSKAWKYLTGWNCSNKRHWKLHEEQVQSFFILYAWFLILFVITISTREVLWCL